MHARRTARMHDLLTLLAGSFITYALAYLLLHLLHLRGSFMLDEAILAGSMVVGIGLLLFQVYRRQRAQHQLPRGFEVVVPDALSSDADPPR